MSGHHNRCLKGEDVIVGRHGGYADKVRCQATFAFPLPPNMGLGLLALYSVVGLQFSIHSSKIILEGQIMWLSLVSVV